MSLLHPAILYGLGLVALPVVLHLLLKQKPKKLLFPALQLIANRRKQNVSRMRLRHFWLLLLRMLVIGLLVVAIARPSVPAADYSLNLREIVTIVTLIAMAIGVYVFLSRRWGGSAIPRHEQRFRQTRLRSWLIGGTLALLLLLVAWPYQRRIAAELKAPTPTGDVSLPVAAVFLFDTSLSMTYQQEGKTRLDVAQDLAVEHLSDLAAGSRVAVADGSNDNPILFQTTIAGAKTRIESLEPQPLSLPLDDRIRAALRLHQDDRARTLNEQSSVADDERTDRFLRRIYVLSDLAKSAFRIGGTSRLVAELEEQPNVNLFLVDVSEPSPINTALVDVEPARVRLSTDGSLAVKATLVSTGGRIVNSSEPATDAGSAAEDDSNGRTGGPSYTVELILRDTRGEPIKVDQQTVEAPDETPQVLTFANVRPEPQTVIHGDVRLVASDPLPFDDIRHFTVEVRPPTSVLVVAPTADESGAWSIALDVQRYAVTVRPPEELPREKLRDYQVICLINVPSLPDNDWYRLGQFVEQGGGLAVFLGSRDINSVNYRRDEAQVFLPGEPDVHSAPGVSFFRVENDDHPIFQPLTGNDGVAIFESADVTRFWRVIPAAETTVLSRYTEDREAPALLERIHGKGRTVMMTTAVDIKGYDARGRNLNWTILPTPTFPSWTFLVFADSMMRHLSHESETRLTYDVGEVPVLRLPAEADDRTFLLQQPRFRQARLTLPGAESVLTIREATSLGHYDLKTTGDRSSVVAGFSVNARADESDLTPIEPSELDERFGEERYQVARSIGELKESINIADLGRELFPLILTALILFFLSEHFVANWFYDDDQATDSRSSWTSTTTETPVTEPAVATSTA